MLGCWLAACQLAAVTWEFVLLHYGKILILNPPETRQTTFLRMEKVINIREMARGRTTFLDVKVVNIREML